MKTVCVVGNFGDGLAKVSDGQGIKTIELYDSLRDYFGSEKVCCVNLFSKKKIRIALLLCLRLFQCRNFIVLVSVNGRKTIIPLLVKLNAVFRRNIYHSLIGSTTHLTLSERSDLIPVYNKLSGNWSETNTEKRLLEEQGLTNVKVIKNFKNISVLSKDELVYHSNEPYRFCSFSRVEAMKGITDIVDAINDINRKHGRIVCTLDIYGKVMDSFSEEFEKLKNEFGAAIEYKGIVDYEKSVETIKDYYMVVFPTRYYTEGIPGTIIDSLASGVPVLCSEWESCFDILSHGTALTYRFGDINALIDALEHAIENPDEINSLKEACLAEAEKYSSATVIESIAAEFERE